MIMVLVTSFQKTIIIIIIIIISDDISVSKVYLMVFT